MIPSGGGIAAKLDTAMARVSKHAALKGDIRKAIYAGESWESVFNLYGKGENPVKRTTLRDWFRDFSKEAQADKEQVFQAVSEGQTWPEVRDQLAKGEGAISEYVVQCWFGDAMEALRSNSDSEQSTDLGNQGEKSVEPPVSPTSKHRPPPGERAIAVSATVVPLRPKDAQHIPKDAQHIPLEDASDGLSDFELARKVARNVANSGKLHPAVRIQAVNALLKTVVMASELPPHVLTGEDQSSLAQQVEDLESLSDEEVDRLYQEALG